MERKWRRSKISLPKANSKKASKSFRQKCSQASRFNKLRQIRDNRYWTKCYRKMSHLKRIHLLQKVPREFQKSMSEPTLAQTNIVPFSHLRLDLRQANLRSRILRLEVKGLKSVELKTQSLMGGSNVTNKTSLTQLLSAIHKSCFRIWEMAKLCPCSLITL